MPKQLQDRSAAHDLVVENDDVAAMDIANQRRDPDLGVAQPFLRARRHRRSQPSGEGRGTLGISEIGRNNNSIAEVVALEILREFAECMEMIDWNIEEPV